MSIPLYFALSWKDSAERGKTLWAQFGYGLTADGAVRQPERRMDGALAIVDDATLPKDPPDEWTLRCLRSLCQNGCFLDFEQTPQPIHTALLLDLARELPAQTLLAAPEHVCRGQRRILPVVTQPARCPSWEAFVMDAGQRHAGGWMLELVPCSYTVQLPFCANQTRLLPDALCFCSQSGTRAHYYDNQETVRRKLTLAEKYGCRAAIGLYDELIGKKR